MVNVVPAPFGVEPGRGRASFRSGLAVVSSDAALVPIVERFCRDVARRTGLRVEARPSGGEARSVDGLPIRVEIADSGDLAALPATLGVAAAAGPFPDERYSLSVGAD